MLLFLYFLTSEVHAKAKNYNEDPQLVLHPNAKHFGLPILSEVTYRASGVELHMGGNMTCFGAMTDSFI